MFTPKKEDMLIWYKMQAMIKQAKTNNTNI